jgi:hypothetical protein
MTAFFVEYPIFYKEILIDFERRNKLSHKNITNYIIWRFEGLNFVGKQNIIYF